MSNIERINLSFNLEQEEARIAYEILINQPGNTKTAYVVKLISSAIKEENKSLDEELIKRCLRDVLKDYDFSSANDNKQNKKEEDAIPDDIMDLLTNI